MQKKWSPPKKKCIPPCTPVKNIEIDWKLLKKLLSYRTYSLDEKAQKEFSDYLCAYIHTLGEIDIEEDLEGNLYITKGKSDLYPCIVAHQDINQDEIPNFMIVQTSKLMFGIDRDNGRQCGLGFDDKCGVYFALHCLKTMDNVKVFLSTNEEIGAVGTGLADMSFFIDCSFIIQGDRNSWENDVSSYTNGVDVVSDEFIDASQRILNKYGYKYTDCLFTDVGELVKQDCGISAINFSVGYYNEHFEDEVLSIPHFINAIAFGEEMIEEMKHQKWEHSPYISVYSKEEPGAVYHEGAGWNFQKEDYPYVQECLAIGECPLCASNKLEQLANGTIVCDNCESYYNLTSPEKGLKVY